MTGDLPQGIQLLHAGVHLILQVGVVAVAAQTCFLCSSRAMPQQDVTHNAQPLSRIRVLQVDGGSWPLVLAGVTQFIASNGF